MIGESFAIVALIAVMIFMAVRQGRRILAFLSLPYVFIPAAYLVCEALLWTLRSMTALPVSALRVIAVSAGLGTGVAVCILVSRGIAQGRAKALYLFLSLSFMAALSVAYFIRMM